MSASHPGDFCDDCDNHVDSCACRRCKACSETFNPDRCDSDELCRACFAKQVTLEALLEASVDNLPNIVSRFDLPSEAALNATHAELARLLREPPKKRAS